MLFPGKKGGLNKLLTFTSVILAFGLLVSASVMMITTFIINYVGVTFNHCFQIIRLFPSVLFEILLVY